MSTESICLPLDALHRALDARMVDFAGYQMPVQYPTGLKTEHLHTREKAGLFDVSHMGQLRVTAKDNKLSTLHRALEAALPVDFEGWESGEQRYSMLLNDHGGIEDDLMISNLGDEVRLVVNAANRNADMAWLQAHCPDLTFTWIDAALIALQGPSSEAALCQLDPSAASMRFMQVAQLNLIGASCMTSRSGYTGEDGFEISIPVSHVGEVVDRLLAHSDVAPIGLGARDSLRLEAGLPLHGNDITAETTPVQARLAFAIARSRRSGKKAGGFPGASVILDQFANGIRTRLCGLASTENVPVRAGASIVDGDDTVLGTVCSGTISPTLNQPIMMAWMDETVFNRDDPPPMFAQVRSKRPAVTIVKLPFVPKRYKR